MKKVILLTAMLMIMLAPKSYSQATLLEGDILRVSQTSELSVSSPTIQAEDSKGIVSKPRSKSIAALSLSCERGAFFTYILSQILPVNMLTFLFPSFSDPFSGIEYIRE